VPETKICPDCAESVLAAARKCRFCGYRFDGPRPSAARSLLERLGIVRQQRQATLQEVLADWGIAADQEEVIFFRYGQVDEQYGYLLVTDRRMLFFADHRKEQLRVFEHRLDQVQAVDASGRGRALIVSGYDFRHVIHAGSRKALRMLGDRLAGRAQPTPRADVF
jgi:hypothetical protein